MRAAFCWIKGVLIQLKFFFPVDIVFQFLLSLFVEKEITHNKVVHFGTHKTAKSVIRSTNNGFTPYIKRSIDHYAIAGLVFKFVDERPIPWVGIFVHTLYPGRIVDVRNGRHIRAQMIQPIIQLHIVVSCGFGSSPLISNLNKKKNIR